MANEWCEFSWRRGFALGCALFLSACASRPMASPSDSLAVKLHDAANLTDTDYYGGLSVDDDALAGEIAAASGIAPGPDCAPPDPLEGTLVGNVGKPKSVKSIDAIHDPRLRALAAAVIEASSRHARDVVARAIGKLGQAARPMLELLDQHADASPWLREVDGLATCQRVSAVYPDKVLVDKPDCARHECAGGPYCTAFRTLLRHMNDEVRSWPADVLGGYGGNFGCRHEDSLPPLVAGILGNAKQSNELRADALALALSVVGDSLTQDQRRQWLEAIEQPLLEIAQVGDENARWQAESLLIELGARSAPQRLARRITAADWVSWSREVCQYAKDDTVLVPALVTRLKDDRVWDARTRAAGALRCLATSEDIAALTDALVVNDHTLQEEAIRTLSHRHPLPAPSRQALESIAANHWAPRLQRLAGEALAGPIADPKEDLNTICIGLCPPDMEQRPCRGEEFDDGMYRLGDEGAFEVRWKAIGDKSLRLDLPKELAERPKYCDVSEFRSGSERFVGTVCFEYTGGLYVIDAHQHVTQLFSQGTAGAFAVNGRVVAIAAAFLFAQSGAMVMGVDTRATDQDKIKPLSAWPGPLPEWYAYSPAGKLLLSNGSVALAVDENGQLARLQCP